MKKLRLVSKIIGICLLMFSCKNTQHQKTVITTEAKFVDHDSLVTIDTMKSNIQTVIVDSNVAKEVTMKDSSKNIISGKAIIHNAPDQAKLDSIKAAKLKLKK